MKFFAIVSLSAAIAITPALANEPEKSGCESFRRKISTYCYEVESRQVGPILLAKWNGNWMFVPKSVIISDAESAGKALMCQEFDIFERKYDPVCFEPLP
mgnify:CR=1 FL=1